MSSDELAAIAQKLARGGLFLFIGDTSSPVILAIGAIVVARLLGPSSYGLYTLALVVLTLLTSLADIDMNYALVRLPARLGAGGDRARVISSLTHTAALKADASPRARLRSPHIVH